MKKHLVLFIVIVSLLTCCTRKHRDKVSNTDLDRTFSGKVIKIIDGDTYDLLTDDNRTIRIRMEGIDAPEKGMPFYKVSKKYLGKLCMNQKIKIQNNGEDEYGRIIAFSFLRDGRELGHLMIQAGMAWHFKKYNSDTDLAALEIEARANKMGLWADKCPIPPWEVRKLYRDGNSYQDIQAKYRDEYCE